jgi:hypothetical protein
VRKNSSTQPSAFGENTSVPVQTCQSCNVYLGNILKSTPWTTKPWNQPSQANGTRDSPHCAECSDLAQNCTICEPSFFLHESGKKCVKTCTKGFWAQQTSGFDVGGVPTGVCT